MKTFLILLTLMLLLGGIATVITGIWLGGDLVAKMVWTGLVAFGLGVLMAAITDEAIG